METKEAHEYTFVNYPEQRTREDYADAIKKIVDLHRDMKEVIALYRFGSISAPGISDIDYFIVTKGEDFSFRYKCPHDKLTKKEKYLFQHYPSAIVPQRLLSQLHFLAPFFEIECIYQREGYSLDVPDIEISKEEARMFLADVIFVAYPGVFVCMVENKTMDIHAALTILYAIRYPIALLRKIGVKKKEWVEFIQEVEMLRKEWFNEQQREEQIIHLLNKAVAIAMDIIVSYDKLSENKRKNEGNKQWKSRTISVRFEEKYDAKNALNEMKSGYARNKKFISILPQSINTHLQKYAEIDNSFGKYVRKYLGGDYTKNNDSSELEEKRAQAMGALLDYAMSIDYRRGAFTPFNLGYLDHVGYINRIRDLWRIFFLKIF